MIKELKLTNIQSHKNTELRFSKGINCIVGSSNNGKSAILRGLYWCRYNRPLGIDTLCSHWALDKKGNLKDVMEVSVTTLDGNTVIRRRTKGNNQYLIRNSDGEESELNVVKTDVPAEVEDFLNLSDINIQRQMDAPFLISNNGGEIAKYFNKIVHLDIIDRVLSNAESNRRRTKSDMESIKKRIEQNKSDAEKYYWLDDAEKSIAEYEKEDFKYSEILGEISKIEALIGSYLSYEKKISDVSTISNLKCKLQKLDNVRNINTQLSDEYDTLSNLISQYAELSDLKFDDLSQQKKIVEKILNMKIDDSEVNKLESIIYEYKIKKMNIENADADIKCLKKQLPDICPLCGNPMNNGVCENENDNNC